MLTQLNPQVFQHQQQIPPNAIMLDNLLSQAEKIVSENYGLRLRLILMRRQELNRQMAEIDKELLELNKQVTQWKVDVENKYNVDIKVENGNSQFALPRKKPQEVVTPEEVPVLAKGDLSLSMASITFLDNASVIRTLVLDFTPDFVSFTLRNGDSFYLDVWRSSKEGEWSPLNSNTHTPAILPDSTEVKPTDSTLGTTFVQEGMTLSLKVNSTQYDIVFSTSDNVANLLPEIVNQTQGAVGYFMMEGKSYIYTSRTVGEYARLEVLDSGESDASILFGWSPGLVTRGREPRPQLNLNTTRYVVRDLEYGSNIWYKWRLISSDGTTVTSFSLPFQEVQAQPDIVSERVLAYVNVVDLRGNPDPYREFFFSAEGIHNIKGYIITDNKFSKKTDAFGHLEVYLLRGAVVRFQIAGQELSRQITVPTDPDITSFSLFDPAYSSDDSFAVQKRDIEWAPRRG